MAASTACCSLIHIRGGSCHGFSGMQEEPECSASWQVRSQISSCHRVSSTRQMTPAESSHCQRPLDGEAVTVRRTRALESRLAGRTWSVLEQRHRLSSCGKCYASRGQSVRQGVRSELPSLSVTGLTGNGAAAASNDADAVNGALNGRTFETKVGHGEKTLKGDPVIIDAEITGATDEFFASEADGSDPDRPTAGFSSVAEAVEAIRKGEFVVVVDDEDRENEGDLIVAAGMVTTEKIAFMTEHTSGVICVGMKGERLDELEIPLMVPTQDNEEALLTAFAVTVDARVGTTTGISSSDRAVTIRLLADSDAKPEHFKKPGHIFPLRYREGGVLKRAGHTEASVDLAAMAGLSPVGVLSEITTKDRMGMARLPELKEFASEHGLHIISIADLVRYKRKREKLVERTAVARLPTEWGDFSIYSYKSKLDGIEHVAMVKGEIGSGVDVLVRVHSECLTGDIFGSRRCDCGPQLHLAMQKIEEAGRGVVVYLRGHEGRGIGLGHKLRAYNLQDAGRDTVEANVELGLPIDSREYGIGAQILRDIGVRTMRLMTNNPAKYMGLRGYGLAVTGRVPVFTPITTENRRYLETKRSKMGHIYGSDLPGTFSLDFPPPVETTEGNGAAIENGSAGY